MAIYTKYAGSPDIFNQEGKRITEQEASTAGLFMPEDKLSPDVQILNTPRPDIKTEADFATLGGTNLPTYTPEIPTKLTENDFQTNINELMAENKAIRDKYLASLKPSQGETDLGTQIADIQGQIGKQEGAFKQGIQDISQKRISMPLITGQQAALGRQAQLDVQTLATQEKNLLTRLGLAQEARQSDQKILETGMSFIAQDIELQTKMQERIDSEQDRILQRSVNMSALQKQTLSQFADAFKSYAPEQMESFQSQIAQMATKAGIPIDLALATIKSAQDEYAFGQMKEQQGQTLAKQKVEEDKRQFDLTYALAQQKAERVSEETYKPPTSYQEWDLAGKPGTYVSWLKEQNVKAPTTAQQTVSEYAARIEQANPIIEQLEKDIKNMNYISFAAQIKLPSAFQSEKMQQYMQSARNFINAKLRRESGAVIAESEFTEARQQYLPQPGDSDNVLADKKANRDLVYSALRNASGNAYQSVDELLGEQGKIILDGATKSGMKYKVIQ